MRDMSNTQVKMPNEDSSYQTYKFGPSSSWTLDTLHKLRVKFSRDKPNGKDNFDWDKLFDKAGAIDDIVQEQIKEGISQLSAIRINDLVTRKVSKKVITNKAKFFRSTYKALLSLVRDKKDSRLAPFEDVGDLSPAVSDSADPNFELPSSTSASCDASQTKRNSPASSPGYISDDWGSIPSDHSNDNKRSTSPHIVNPPSKRTRTMYSPSNTILHESMSQTSSPTSEPSPTSNLGSITSCNEQYSRSFLVAFVTDARQCVQMDILPWCNSKDIVELDSGNHTMKFTLGCETVIAKNDGDLHIIICDMRREREWRTQKRVIPVLSLEAKRKKHAIRDKNSTVEKHSAQVFCEMLGQVCHKEFYNNPAMKRQEAFVLHVAHDVFFVYYCNFPNSYLSEIVKHGYKFRESSKRSVTLIRTKKYHMNKIRERVEFFQFFAKLLWYIRSGRSHVGYLFNYKENPLHQIGGTKEFIQGDNSVDLSLENNSEEDELEEKDDEEGDYGFDDISDSNSEQSNFDYDNSDDDDYQPWQ